MPTNDEAAILTTTELVAFCKEFLESPYLCYTEHGLHCRFAARLYHAIPASKRYQTIGGHRMCRVQKEYPTHVRSNKPRRQNWDVSLIAKANGLPCCEHPYDHLPVATVVEFGLNCPLRHLRGDVRRLSAPNSNVHQGFIAHLFRLSVSRGRLSGRDWSPRSRRLHAADAIQPHLAGTTVQVYLGVFDPTNRNPSGLWRITADEIASLVPSDLQARDATFPGDQDDHLAPGR